MHPVVSSLVLALAMGQTPRECHQTANFVVYAESSAIAEKVAESAETNRRRLAKLWLGKELPDWPNPCRIDVNPAERAGGVTEITYADGKVMFQRVSVRGPLERVLAGPLPHELTHVMFAHHFGRPLPRWADEGGAIVSEGTAQRAAHRKAFGEMLLGNRQFPLRQLLNMKSYPSDIPCLYAQGHSVSTFLVAAKGHQTFLSFLQSGMDGDWDEAVRSQYGYQNVEQLERAWLDALDKDAKDAR
jgi:hypothetical protein